MQALLEVVLRGALLFPFFSFRFGFVSCFFALRASRFAAKAGLQATASAADLFQMLKRLTDGIVDLNGRDSNFVSLDAWILGCSIPGWLVGC